jgi:hypothetical protein
MGELYAVNATGCWVWTGLLTGRGYAATRVGNCTKAAHRIYFEERNGRIPKGMVLDHICRNIRCVNPDHLEIVTVKENTMRGIGPTAINALKTHCSRGHPFTEENTHMRRGRRYCRKCQAEYNRQYRRKQAALRTSEEK